ncbi:MAG: helix-turn-helix domain-containing protein [Candidatus Brocadiae bacterium]|nr:helix-turn-helix domain-containing protein [Candidatus Brocadiia bacterium]
MSKMEDVLRAEIERLVQKEARAACKPLAKQVRELSQEVRRLPKEGVTGSPDSPGPALRVELPDVSAQELEKARFSPGLIKKLRKHLNITQVELATLLGTSATTVAFWEQGRNRPEEASQAKIVALRKLGRRDVKRMLGARR